MEHHLSIKKKETFPFVTMWINLVGPVLNVINQTEEDKLCMVSPMWNVKKLNSNKVEWYSPGAGVWAIWGDVGQKV